VLWAHVHFPSKFSGTTGKEQYTLKKIKDMTPQEAEEVREGWRARKQSQRERDAEKEAERVRQNTFDSPLQFWEAQLKKLSEDEIAKLNERQERIFDTLHWMESWANGTYDVDPIDETAYLGLEEGIADLEADVAQHGLTMIEVTLIPFWKLDEKDFLNRVVAKGGATATFIQYGIVTAIPEHRYAAFAQKFMQKRTEIEGSYYAPLTCPCGATSSVPKQIADRYLALQKQYQCGRCLDVEQRSRKLAASAILGTTASEAIYDSWGRVKL
jgi:hypothetical protein